jgi:hypothetical protein
VVRTVVPDELSKNYNMEEAVRKVKEEFKIQTKINLIELGQKSKPKTRKCRQRFVTYAQHLLPE